MDHAYCLVILRNEQNNQKTDGLKIGYVEHAVTVPWFFRTGTDALCGHSGVGNKSVRPEHFTSRMLDVRHVTNFGKRGTGRRLGWAVKAVLVEYLFSRMTLPAFPKGSVVEWGYE